MDQRRDRECSLRPQHCFEMVQKNKNMNNPEKFQLMILTKTGYNHLTKIIVLKIIKINEAT